MSGITLVLTICSVLVAGAHIALVNGEATRNRPVNLHPRNLEGGLGTWGLCYACDDCDKVAGREPCKVNFYNGCVTYTELDLKSFKRRVVRGCAARLSSCEEIQKQHNRLNGSVLLSCDQCPDDLCNDPIQKNSNK